MSRCLIIFIFKIYTQDSSFDRFCIELIFHLFDWIEDQIWMNVYLVVALIENYFCFGERGLRMFGLRLRSRFGLELIVRIG